jgi:hypothetical protein
MGIGDVGRSMLHGEGHTERKKYDPIYKIDVRVGTKRVIYIGRVGASVIHPNLIKISGVKSDSGKEELTYDGGEELLKDGQVVEVSYPSESFVEIKTLPKK